MILGILIFQDLDTGRTGKYLVFWLPNTNGTDKYLVMMISRKHYARRMFVVFSHPRDLLTTQYVRVVSSKFVKEILSKARYFSGPILNNTGAY